MKKYNLKHIGEKHTTNEGYELTVIDGGSKNGCCTVRIKDWIGERNYINVTRGEVSFPYSKTICNIGYLGKGKFKKSINHEKTKAYKTWIAIIQRCYSENIHKRQPTYIGCKVDIKWYNFQIFAKWFEKYYVEGWEIDKDLLSSSEKIYSEDNCCFLPRSLNTFLQENNIKNTSGIRGVLKKQNQKKWIAQFDRKHLGSFINIEDAEVAYKKAKKEKLLILIEKYKDKLEPRVIDKLKEII